MRVNGWDEARTRLFRDDAIGPLNQVHKNCGIAEFCTPLRQVYFRDPTGPAAGPSSKDGNVFGGNFVESFAEGRPTDGDDGVGGDLTHQIRGFAEKEDLNFVAGFVESEGMQKGECGFGRIIGAPCTLHHNLEILFGLIGFRTKREKGQAQNLSEELTSRHRVLR